MDVLGSSSWRVCRGILVLATLAVPWSAPGGQRSEGPDTLPGVLARSDAANDPTRVSTPHLSLTTSVARRATASSVDVMVDVTPKPAFRIYAAGAKDYQPVTLSIETTSGVALRRSTFPKPQTITMEGDPERVPAYVGPFRVVARLALDRPRQADLRAGRQIVVAGTLAYQACDDRVCYKPVSVPVRWTVLPH